MRYAHLTRKERYQIEELLQTGSSVCCIARKLHVHRSTVYRELQRSGGSRQGYSASRAQQAAERRIRRSAANHPTKPASSLWKRVRRYLRRDWSPDEARGWLWRWFGQSVSVPAIYAHIQRDRKRGGRLHEHLRYANRKRRWGTAHGGMSDSRPSIKDRPDHVRTRSTIGHWEGDTFVGSSRIHHTLTLVERMSRFVIMRHPHRSYSDDIARAAIQCLRAKKVDSITFDNGAQFAQYKSIQSALKCKVYFADPGRPNQRATCENTIGLIRQYIPKGSSGHHLTPRQLQRIADTLNHRPRRCLGYKTPFEVFFNHIPVALRT